VLIIGVDALLALPSHLSGQVAAAHVLAAILLAGVLQGTPNADWGLTGGMMAAYRVGAWLPVRASAVAFAALAVSAGVGASIAYGASIRTILLAAASNALIPWMIGRYTSSRRGYIEELRHNREMEIMEATAQMELASGRLRTSISRDLHDAVSHHVSAIGAHAGAARLRLAASPAPDPKLVESLTAVETSSHSAMLDLRRILDVLHQISDPISYIGVADLNDLFSGMQLSGLPIRYCVLGSARPLPAQVDQALYRITQELLTNALRYGDGTAVEITLAYEPDKVSLSALNAIAAEPNTRDSTGSGLAGIRSRVELFGGQASFGPAADGNTWQTQVTIPTEPQTEGDL
jgi:signal transduction histidine kinase